MAVARVQPPGRREKGGSGGLFGKIIGGLSGAALGALIGGPIGAGAGIAAGATGAAAGGAAGLGTGALAGGLLGSAPGAAAGAALGGALKGFGPGSAIGGISGELADPRKVQDFGPGASPLQSALRTQPDVQLAQLEATRRAIPQAGLAQPEADAAINIVNQAQEQLRRNLQVGRRV